MRFDPDANADKVEAGTQEQAGKNHTRAFLELNARELHPWACSVNIHDEPLARAPNQSRSLLDYLGVDKGSALYPAAPRLNLKYEEIPYVSKHEARRAEDATATRCRRPPSDAASNIRRARTSVRAWACTTGYVC